MERLKGEALPKFPVIRMTASTVLGALQQAEKHGEWIEFIQVRPEEMAAFMATAHRQIYR